MTATAETNAPPLGTATVSMTADFDIIPLFQFAIFYEEDLEILPGPDMWLAGRVHSNQDIYIGCNSTLTIDSAMTSAGDIFNFRKNNGATMGGDVAIRDSVGGYPTMSGLDSTDPNWVSDALDRWDGNVRSQEHDVDRLNLTIEDPSNPRTIIEPGRPGDTPGDQDAKIWYDADLRLVNGQAEWNDGTPVSTIDPLTGDDSVQETVIFDQREQKFMLSVEVDMEKLGRSPAWPKDPFTGDPLDSVVCVAAFEPVMGMPAWPNEGSAVGPVEWTGYNPPWSGIGDTEFAVKLTNGDTLPAPVSMVSDNPVYIRGDFNDTNKVGAAVLGDSVTILSNRWGDNDGDGTIEPGEGDLAYSQLSLNNRNAWNTEANAALMLGNTDTVPGVQYNGVVDNVLRFMERWSGDTLRYRGSIIDLWNSVYATGNWIYGNPVYTAPNRDWGFDTDFLDPANLPPSTPNVYTIRVIGWARQ